MAETWVLILTLTFSQSGSIATVPGFTSVSDCRVAGLVWQKDASRVAANRGRAHFTCIAMNPKSLPAEAPLEDGASTGEAQS